MLAEPATRRDGDDNIRCDDQRAPFTSSMYEWVGRTATVVREAGGDKTDLSDTDFYLKFDEPITRMYIISPFMLEPVVDGTITGQIAALEAQVAKLKADYAESLRPKLEWPTRDQLLAWLPTVPSDVLFHRRGTAGTETKLTSVYFPMSAPGAMWLVTQRGPDVKPENFAEFDYSTDKGATWISFGFPKAVTK